MQIRFSSHALKQLKKIDRPVALRIIDYLERNVAPLDEPRQIGKALQGQLTNLWRYRIGDYRVIVEIQDSELIIQVIKIGHRKDIY